MTRKSGKHLRAIYGSLNSCFDLIRSHQQCKPWSLALEIDPTTTGYRGRKNLHLGHRSKPHLIDAKLTSHGGNARPLNLMCLEGTFFKYDVTLQRTRSPLRPLLPKLALCNRINLTSYIYIVINPVRWQKLLGSAMSGSTALSYRNCVITLVGDWWGQSFTRAFTRCMMNIYIYIYIYIYIHIVINRQTVS